MENCVDESINNDFLSQSYSQRIERITGTKDCVFNFQIPKKLLEVRKRTWDNLFDKYSRKMSDDIEINVDTLEPEEEQDEKEVSEEEYSYGQRIPMRKSATLVQYWINTGNPPYKVLLDENELSETGSSLSEKEIIPSLHSLISNVINEDDEREHKNESSCSSVDTAAYILSNANVTKKADTIAIIEGAKCININSSRNMYIKDIEVASNDKIDYIETPRADDTIHNNDNSNVNTDTEFPMSTEYTKSKTCDRLTTGTVISANIVQPNACLQTSSCKETDKIDDLSTNQRSLNVQSIDDIASIFRQFDGTSRRLTRNDRNNIASIQDETLEKDTFCEKQVSTNIEQEIIAEDTSMTAFHRKKLYTGRDSPVDLILTKRHSISRLSGTKQSLHPALDPDSMIKRETFLVRKSRNKHLSPSDKKGLSFEKAKRKRRRKRYSVLRKNIADTSNKVTNNNIQDSIIDCSFNSLTDSDNNSDRRVDIPLREHDDTNISVKDNETCKQNLSSLNLNPVVVLERITPSFKQFESKSVITLCNHTVEESNICNNRRLNNSRKLYTCEIENLEMIDSDESTILICQCKMNTSQRTSSPSNQSLNLRLSIEDDSSASNAVKKDGEASSLKNTSLKNINQNQELRVILEKLQLSANKDYTNTVESQILNKNDTIRQEEILNKRHSSNSYGGNKTDNVKLRDIKVVLERLPLSVNKNCTNRTMETQILNNNGTTWQKEVLNKTHFSNPYRTNKVDNAKLPEIKVALERLSPNVYLKRSNNITNANTFADKKKILRNTSLRNDKIESRITSVSKILPDENVKASESQTICNNYPSKMHAKSKKVDVRINDTSDIIVERGNQVIEKIKTNSTFQYKNYNKVSRDNHNKYSVLTFTSSDEDDLVRLIKRPKKRSKMSKDDKTLGETNTIEKDLFDKTKLVIANKDRYHFSGNPSTIIHSSRKVREIDPIEMKREQNGVEIKSFGNKTATASFTRMCKNERFLFFPNESDYENNTAENLDERKKKTTFLKCNKSMNNDDNSRLDKTMKDNELDYRLDKDDVRVIFFQTKTFDSSDSEESNGYSPLSASTRKASPKNSPVRHRSRYYNHTNSEVFFNDPVAKRCSTKHSSSLNSSLEKHDVAYRVHNIRTRSRSIGKAKVSKHLVNEEFNEDINSRVNNTKKNMSSFVDNTRNASAQEKTFLYTSVKENNVNTLSGNKRNSEKSKNLVVIQQDNVKPAIRKLLTFQTKNYYDSDSE